jgi:hypothetical protein
MASASKSLKTNTSWHEGRWDSTAAVEFQDRYRKPLGHPARIDRAAGWSGANHVPIRGFSRHPSRTSEGPTPARQPPRSLRHSTDSASTKRGLRKPRRLSPSTWASAMSWLASASLKSGFWRIRLLKFFGSFIPIAV